MTGGPVGVDLFLIHEFHFLITLGPDISCSPLNHFVVCSFVPVFKIFVFRYSFLFFSWSHRHLRQVHSSPVSRLSLLISVLIDGLVIQNL